MPIQLGISNSLKSLVDQLSGQLNQHSSVFQPVYIVTQTAGMNIWLKQQLAQKLGIAANIQFLKPNDAIHLLFRKLSGRYLANSISAHDLNWLIFDILEEKEFKSNFQKIAEYYNQDGLEGEIKRMALAEKIADLFDQYQVYRASEIEHWNEGKNWESLKIVRDETDEAWQKYIWNCTREIAKEKFSDKTYIGKYILAELDNPESVAFLQKEVPAIYFFGLSLITEYHLQIIYKVSEYIKVEFLFQNPAPWKYWYEDRSEKIVDFLKHIGKYESHEQAEGNPLLTSWGRLTQNTFKMFFKDDDTLNALEDFGVIEPSSDSLLHYVQNSIFNNEKNDIHFSYNQISDGSITLNSCYSPTREVEVLYNYLVHLIDQKKENLSARDIIVMVSDIDLYGSYIKAVFDNAPYKFNYTIADESYVVSDTISNALHSILSMGEGQFTSEKVISLLDFSAIRKRFQIEDLDSVRRAVESANIRFGFAGKREDDTDYVSWEYGLNRIMFGLCMHGGEEYGEGETSFYPIDMAEGFDMFNLVRFVNFVRVLKQNIKSRTKNRDITQWVKYVEESLYTFIGEINEDPDEDYILLQNHLEQYNRLEDFYKKNVDYEVFKYNFLPTLTNARRSSNFASYGITFCSLIPMRSIPFKVVALLGMDLDKFPRQNRPVSFDLIEKKKQTGDRDIKENDKQLFLDTLLSAEKYFYLSYVGQSSKNNEPIPPSALVDELVDFIATRSEDADEVRSNFIQRHPLHGFSKKYNTRENPELYSYLLRTDTEITKPLGERKEQEFDFDEIDISRLISFLRNPPKGYYQRVLNCYYDEEEIGLEEVEKFDLNKLEEWVFKDRYVIEAEEISAQFIDRHKKLGKLPLKNMAHIQIDKIIENINPTRDAYIDCCGGEEEAQVEIHLPIKNSILTGKIDGNFGENLIRYSVSSKSDERKLAAYIENLILAAKGIDRRLHFVDKTGNVFRALPINKEEALEKLSYLVSLYTEGHKEMLPFHFDLVPDKEKDKKDLRNFYETKLDSYLVVDDYNKFPDIYLQKAIRAGEFTKEGKFERYEELHNFYTDIIENKYETI